MLSLKKLVRCAFVVLDSCSTPQVPKKRTFIFGTMKTVFFLVQCNQKYLSLSLPANGTMPYNMMNTGSPHFMSVDASEVGKIFICHG